MFYLTYLFLLLTLDLERVRDFLEKCLIPGPLNHGVDRLIVHVLVALLFSDLLAGLLVSLQGKPLAGGELLSLDKLIEELLSYVRLRLFLVETKLVIDQLTLGLLEGIGLILENYTLLGLRQLVVLSSLNLGILKIVVRLWGLLLPGRCLLLGSLNLFDLGLRLLEYLLLLLLILVEVRSPGLNLAVVSSVDLVHLFLLSEVSVLRVIQSRPLDSFLLLCALFDFFELQSLLRSEVGDVAVDEAAIILALDGNAGAVVVGGESANTRDLDVVEG